MGDFFFISYSSTDGKDFAMKLVDELAAGMPAIRVWLDRRALRPGEDWDEQIQEAIKTCKGVIFVLSADSVRPDSVTKNEWVLGLRYKKPVIPLLLDRHADLPFLLGSREYINFADSFDSGLDKLRKHLLWMDSPEGQLQALKFRLSDAERELPRAEPDQQVRIREEIAELERQIANQQDVIDNCKGAEQRVQPSIGVGLEGAHMSGRTYFDGETGLMWTIRDNGSDVTWSQANEYAQHLRLGGHADWRLPTIDELEELHDPQNGGIRSPFKVHGLMWSSTKSGPDHALFFNFWVGMQGTLPLEDTTNQTRAFSVRRAEG
jgi:hypothetical protein